MPGPQVCVGGCLRVFTRGMAVGARFPGRRGRRPLRLAREWAAAEGRGGVRAPRPTDGDMETPAGFTRTPVSGPPHGRGRACPARGLA